MTKDLENRIKEHNFSSTKSAKYLRGKTPVKLVYIELFEEIKSAMRRELQVKKWTRAKKLALIDGDLDLLKKL